MGPSFTSTLHSSQREAQLPLLPLPEDLVERGQVIASTSYSDQCKTDHFDAGLSGRYLAVKRLRFRTQKDKEMLLHELHVWPTFSHPNLFRLLGYAFDSIGYPLLIAEWIENGSAWTYVRANPDCDVLRIIKGAAQGIEFIHGKQAVHSDIKSDNILVSDSGDALVCDFGISRLVSASSSISNMSYGPTSTSPTRYLAYELLAKPSAQVHYTTMTDVWAFGMTVYELMTGQRPYQGLPERAIFSKIKGLETPEFPPIDGSLSCPLQIQSDAIRCPLWDVCLDCWNGDPATRVDMASLVERLGRIPSGGIHQDVERSVCEKISGSNYRRPSSGSENIQTTSQNGANRPIKVDECCIRDPPVVSESQAIPPRLWQILSDVVFSVLRHLRLA